MLRYTALPLRLRSTFIHSNVLSTFEPSLAQESLAIEEEKFSQLLQRCAKTADLDQGKAIHAKFIKESLLSSIFLHNHLLNVYCKCGDLAQAMHLFEEMPEPNIVSWSAVIAGFVQHNHHKQALSIFQQMHRRGPKPNAFTIVSALNACSLSEQLAHAYQIYTQVLKLSLHSNVYLTNSFLTALTRHGRLAEAEEFFEKCQEKDTVSWNAMIAGYLQLSYSGVWRFWCRMNHEGVKPDDFTFATVLTGLAALLCLKDGTQVHAQLVKSGYGDDICVGNALADMYLKTRNLVEGSKVFAEMPSKDVVSWTQMASGCMSCGEPSNALRVVEQMRLMGVRPNKFTLATALNACSNLASLDEGRKAHSLRIKLGGDVDACVDNALLDMYAKCGCMDSAWLVFKAMSDRSVVSWTTMIMGFAQNGYAMEALDMFERMKGENVEPNYISFICVLYACSQGGLIDQGWRYFVSMEQEHWIRPGEDHYACMVDLLGRSGKTAEAEALILSMPFQPSVLVWQTLLGACRIHGDIEVGRRAAEQVLAKDKEDPSAYVLMSNMYANSSNWDGVGRLRELMENRQVKKVPGCSWLDALGDRQPFLSQQGSLT